jgi:hypothetical protein
VLGATAGIAVFFHADKHGSKHASAWGAGVFLLLIVFLPVYIFHVYRTRRRAGRL